MRLFFAMADTIVNPPYQYDFERDTSIFVSYFYAPKAESALVRLQENGHRGLRVVDSGAFSYFSAHGMAPVASQMGAKSKALPTIHEYYRAYLEWLRKNYNLYDYFVEIDLQELFGREVIEEFREGFRKAGLNKKCIHVFHSGDSEEDLDALIANSESRYLGCEGLRLGVKPLPYKSIIQKCYNAKVKLHGFAFTRGQLLLSLPFYSVDSSTHTATLRFGLLQRFDGWNVVSIPVKKKGTASLMKAGAPLVAHPNARGRGADTEKLKYTELEFLKWEKWLTAMWRGRGIVWED